MKTEPKLTHQDRDTKTLLLSLVAAVVIYVIITLITA